MREKSVMWFPSNRKKMLKLSYFSLIEELRGKLHEGMDREYIKERLLTRAFEQSFDNDGF